MDPLHPRVEQSQVTPPHDDFDGDDDESTVFCLGAIEENSDMVMELGFESGSGIVENIGGIDIDDFDFDFDVGDVIARRRDSGREFRDIISTGSDIRLITVESGSDEDDGDDREIWGIDLNEEDVYVNDDEYDEDDDDVNVNIPLCWDSLQLEDRGVTEEEFDWEQVTGRVAAEGELPYYAEADINNNNSISFSVSPLVSLEELATRERAEGSGNLGWEVLPNTQTLEINFDVENRELYIVGDNEDYIQTTEYEMLFEQFAEAGITALGLPPTSKSFIKNLPMVELELGKDDGAVCAVCKEEMSIGNKAAQLPCNHKYHNECIVPWLRVRNTCPVCRYELPTDDAEYEQRKNQRTTTTPEIVL